MKPSQYPYASSISLFFCKTARSTPSLHFSIRGLFGSIPEIKLTSCDLITDAALIQSLLSRADAKVKELRHSIDVLKAESEHFVRSEEREGDGSSGGIEMDDDVEEEYHGHGAQEIETIRNSITQSLMSARNNVNI